MTLDRLVLSVVVAALVLPASAALAQDANNASSQKTEATAEEHGLVWSRDLKESLQEAQKTNKLVLADIYTDWCGWCKHLDKTTFADPKFVDYVSEHFVPVKLNAEDRGQGSQTAKSNDVSGFPTALVFAQDGTVVGRIVGFLDAKKYQSRLNRIAKSSKSHSKRPSGDGSSY